jgi:hypothetical protein
LKVCHYLAIFQKTKKKKGGNRNVEIGIKASVPISGALLRRQLQVFGPEIAYVWKEPDYLGCFCNNGLMDGTVLRAFSLLCQWYGENH